jgi:hypothetical protein
MQSGLFNWQHLEQAGTDQRAETQRVPVLIHLPKNMDAQAKSGSAHQFGKWRTAKWMRLLLGPYIV